ncbi:hypothetical protein [Corynebacterium afermentans]|uniref:hypothetical protein n=1 Tax=Corynebacterium afermentans TaxID=38286 RepID=UPI0025729705|nr:hypothetical protein [Corynebacterium afermentans]MDC7107848.1 hypothetical protein [Corynebacterium afermentans]
MALETNSPTTADTGSVKEVPPPADSAAPPAGDDVAPVAEQENLPAPPASSRDAYAAALADPAQYFADIDGLDGTFTYDLVDVDVDGDTYPTVFTAGMQPGLAQYESDGTTLTATQFELHGNRLVKAHGPEETVVGNPLSGVTLIHWTPTTDAAQLAELDQPDPLNVPREGTMKQVSDIPELNGQSYRVQFGARHGEGRVPVTYPDLGCTGFLEPVHASAGEEVQDGFRETITEGTCDNGGAWHFAINDSRERATYNAPTGRYHAEGPLNRAG